MTGNLIIFLDCSLSSHFTHPLPPPVFDCNPIRYSICSHHIVTCSCVYLLPSNSALLPSCQALKASTEEEKKLLTSGMGAIPAGTTLKTEFSVVLNSESDKVRVCMIQRSASNLSLCACVVDNMIEANYYVGDV